MAREITDAVWGLNLGPYEQLVMLCLADHAGKNATCYPSVRRICERTGMGERGVQNVLKRLAKDGHISVEIGAGRGGSNLYTVNVTPRTECTPPAPDAPAPDAHPPHPITSTPAPGAPKPVKNLDDDDATHRERLLSEMGVDPSGVTGPSGRMIGTRSDMSHVEKWSSAGVSEKDQIAIVRDVMARKRDGPPASFRYFDQAMADFAANKDRPLPSARKPSQQSSDDADIERFNKLAGA